MFNEGAAEGAVGVWVLFVRDARFLGCALIYWHRIWAEACRGTYMTPAGVGHWSLAGEICSRAGAWEWWCAAGRDKVVPEIACD